jgi:hypothetical protein
MQVLIDEKGLSEKTGLALQTLRNARHAGRLFPYIKLGEGKRAAIRYNLKDIEDYLNRHRIDPEGAGL